jgi:hypothetical protein
MDVQGLRIGQTWFTVTSQSITKYILKGYIPFKDVFVLDIEGVSRRMHNNKFSLLDLIDKRADAVIAMDALKLQELDEIILSTEEELTKLKLERDGING